MLGLRLNVATTILGCIFSMLFSDFRAGGLISIPMPPIMPIPRHCPYHNIHVLVCISCLCYDLSQKLSAPVVGLFYLKF